MKKSGVKVVVPLCIGHVSGQIDLLGLAMDTTILEVVVTPNMNSNSLQCVELTGFTKRQKEENLQELTLLGAKSLFSLGSLDIVGVDIKIHIKKKNLPRAHYISGLFMAGAIAINELLRRPFTRRELLHELGELITDITSVHSQVAPLVIGGITTTHSLSNPEVHRLIIPKGIQVTYITNLSQDAQIADNYEDECRVISCLIHGLAMSSFNYIKRALKDQNKHNPAFLKNIIEVNEDLDLLGAIYLSQSNSAIILSANTLVSGKLHERLVSHFEKLDNKAVVLTQSINNEGIQLM